MPEHKKDDDLSKRVETYSGLGLTQEQIASILDIDPKTLRKHYRKELDVGSANATAKVAGALYKGAVEQNCPTRQIFWMKTRGGWSTKTEHVIEMPETVFQIMKKGNDRNSDN